MWDAVIGFSAIHSLSLAVTVLVADKYFSRLSRPLLTLIDAQSVDRSAPGQYVQDTAEAFKSSARMALLITPENTRRHCIQWRTGFHEIARQAEVPLIPIALDYKNRVVTIGDPQLPGRTAEDSVAQLCRFFTTHGSAKHPDRISKPMRDYLNATARAER